MIQRLKSDRVDTATRKRPPLDGDPTAGNARAYATGFGTVSGLGRVKWLEPEPDSDPMNSRIILGFDFQLKLWGFN